MILEVLPAKAGDCLILHCGDAGEPKLILIDGGPAGVWQSSLKDRLLEIRDQNGLQEEDALVIDLVVVSHVDDDHINGIIRLLEFIQERLKDHLPPLFKIKRIWHNSFDNILNNDETVIILKSSQFGTASTATDLEALLENVDDDMHDTAFILASIAQGDDLRRLACVLGIPINPDFGGSLVQVRQGMPLSIKVGDVDLHIAGPLHDDLVRLQAAHDTWLKDHPERRSDPAAILAALDDQSIANLSSIVLLAAHEDKTLLLTGDARGDKILEGLEVAGLLSPGSNLPIDVLKMPHHGSIRNINEEFVERLPAKKYVFCGNGKHGNPDRETFELMFDRLSGLEMSLVFNHPVPEIDTVRKAEHEKEMAKRIRKQKNPGPHWDVSHNSLEALLFVPALADRLFEPQQDTSNLVEP
jgi:hypothetical protein